MSKNQIKVTLTRSIHGRLKAHIACASGLGLTRINQTVSVEDNPCVRGMINKISYMLKVEG
ncbi:MAG: 50S ribosomal protein L30 [Gammaproteobacteria bacterium]|nr:50S ribosomal protein L30 [Gammaproteobacteria bacterium]